MLRSWRAFRPQSSSRHNEVYDREGAAGSFFPGSPSCCEHCGCAPGPACLVSRASGSAAGGLEVARRPEVESERQLPLRVDGQGPQNLTLLLFALRGVLGSGAAVPEFRNCPHHLPGRPWPGPSQAPRPGPHLWPPLASRRLGLSRDPSAPNPTAQASLQLPRLSVPLSGDPFPAVAGPRPPIPFPVLPRLPRG